MNNFSSYAKLSPSYRAFVTNLSKIQIPSNIYEALDRPEWKAVVYEKSEPWRRMALRYY